MVINLSLRVIKSFLINIFTSTMNLFHLQLNLSRLLRLYGLLSIKNIFILTHPNRHILVSFKYFTWSVIDLICPSDNSCVGLRFEQQLDHVWRHSTIIQDVRILTLLVQLDVVVQLDQVLHDVLQGGLGGVLQTHDVLGVAKNLSPVGFIYFFFNFVFYTRLQFITSKKIDSDEKIQ